MNWLFLIPVGMVCVIGVFVHLLSTIPNRSVYLDGNSCYVHVRIDGIYGNKSWYEQCTAKDWAHQ